MESTAYSEMSETEDRHWWFVARRSILLDRIRLLKLPDRPRILEIGVGTGGNLEMLASVGDVSGMEMNDDAIRMAAAKTNGRFDIQQGMCPNGIPSFKEKFDLICMLDVLEHIEEDEQTLAKIGDLLNDNGKLLITVPAYQWLWSAHDEHLFHKRRYTLGRLKKMAHENGWKTGYSSYFNALLFPVIAAVRIKDKLMGNNSYSGHDVPAPALNKILTKIFGFERILLKGLKIPFGVSMMAVFTHKNQ